VNAHPALEQQLEHLGSVELPEQGHYQQVRTGVSSTLQAVSVCAVMDEASHQIYRSVASRKCFVKEVVRSL